MANYRTVLVIGDNHEEIIKKYSGDTECDAYVKYKITEAPKLHLLYINTLETIIKSIQDNISTPNREQQLDYYKELYQDIIQMDDFEFYQELIADYQQDENGNATSTENPNAFYRYPRCYDDEIRKNQEREAPFSNPLILKNGMKVYSAKVGEVDWEKVHMGTSDVYKAVWEICVEGREPTNQDEETAKTVMGKRDAYFKLFNNKDEYVGHCSAFWCYGVATNNEYIECNGRDIDWTNQFYERFIKPLSGNTTITLYEVQLID